MTTAIALPDPSRVTLTEVREKLIPQVAGVRQEIASRADMGAARELCRRLEAFRKYLQDRQGRDLLAAECRRTEVLIGKLLGEPQPGERTDLLPTGKRFDGVPDQDKHKFRLLAAHEDAVEQLLADGKVSRNFILESIQRPRGKPEYETCTVDDLQRLIDAGKTFGVVYADPPWLYDNQRTRAATSNHYDGLSVEEIAAHPVSALAAPKSLLFLWTTGVFLPYSFGIIAAWGFEYKTYAVWIKPQVGIGNYFRKSTELLLVANRGGQQFSAPVKTDWMNCPAVVHDRMRHSKKPAEFRRIIESVSTGPRLELFGREPADGWVVWGNEIERGMFDQDVKEC